MDDKGQTATAEGLFYQLIVRLHKFSLGRVNYEESVHWQRGLVLDDDYNGRALLEHIGNDIRITVRAAYPERFLLALTYEVKWLVENFWEGLRCEVMVPCIEPCGQRAPGTGLFEVQKLIESKRSKRPEYPCPVCNEWQDIDCLLRNAPAARPNVAYELVAEFAEVKQAVSGVRQLLVTQHGDSTRRFDALDANQQIILSKIDSAYAGLLQALTDEAKEGPRLFSLVPVNRSSFNPKSWTSAKFRLTLWCEHSRLPLPELNKQDKKNAKRGFYEIELKREWVKKAAPYLKFVGATWSLALPVAASAIKISIDEAAFKEIEDQLDFGKECLEATVEGGEKMNDWLGQDGSLKLEHGEAIRAQGAILRELQALVKKEDISFGGLVRVRNKRQEFLWVHPQFESEY